jgi:hypothetical protein
LRRIINIFLVLISILITLFFATLFVSWYFEDRIANYAIRELNKQIRTPIRVEKIDFTLLRKFPDATIRLRNVYVRSVLEDYNENQFNEINTDTLLYAKDIFLQFNLINLIKNQYTIKEVQINTGHLNLYTDLDGNYNYRIWNQSDTAKTSNFHVRLNQVKISDLHLLIANLAKKSDAVGDLRKLILHGDLSSEKYIMDFTLNGKINEYSSNNITYLSDKEVFVKSKMNVTGNKFNIIKSNLQIEGLGFDVDGNITTEKDLNLDLLISGRDLNLERIVENLTFLYSAKSTTKMKVKGNLTFNAKISGLLSNTQMPKIESEFSLGNGLISTNFTDQKFDNINLKGYFTNGTKQNAESAHLKFDGVTIDYGNSKLTGTFDIMNLSEPQINYQLKAELNIGDVMPFLKIKNLKYCSGKISIDTKIQGNQQKLLNINKNDIMNWDYNGTINLNDVKLELKKYNITAKSINGNINLTKYLYLNDLNLIISGNELSLKGRIDNFMEYIFTEKAKLWMDLNIYSPNLVLDSFIYSENQNRVNTDSVLFVPPDNFYLKSKLWFDVFNYQKFFAKNMFGELIYKPGSLWFNTEFSSMGGNVKGDGFIEQQKDMNYLVKINSSMEQIDIQNLFYYFNNFGQSYIQDKHLKGQLTGTADYFSLLTPYLTVKKETILAESDIKITNGELNEFEPMLGLSNFIEVEELKHIKFSTLENQVFIRNSEVLIPQMDIYSSAMNISGSGIHGFDNQFNYKVSVDLSDLLLNKSRDKEKELEFEEHMINDDGLNRTKIFLTIEGNPNDYRINYDRKGAVGALKEKLIGEKVELKSILKEEFGLFGKDTIPVNATEEKKQEFFINWEESDVNNSDTIKSGKKEETEEFKIIWDEDEVDTIEQQDIVKKIKK